MTTRTVLGTLIFSVAVVAQNSSADRMQRSLQKQRQSVERQVQAIRKQIKDTGTLRIPAEPSNCGKIAPAQITAIAEQTAARHGVSSALIRAVIQQESGGNACSVSAKGALGLMQIMPETANEIKLLKPFDPEENADAGGRILKQLLTRFSGNVSLALAAYNAGSGAVERAGGIPNYPETQQYVSSILAAIDR